MRYMRVPRSTRPLALLFFAGTVLVLFCSKLISNSSQAATRIVPPPADRSSLSLRHAVHKFVENTDDFEPFLYIIQPKVCAERRVARIVLYVAVPPDRTDDLRAAVRNAWADDAKSRGIETVFLMGRWPMSVLDNRTDDVEAFAVENSKYDDILMANYKDSWESAVMKWWSSVHYHASHCSHVPVMAFLVSNTVIYAENLERFLDDHFIEYVDDVGCIRMDGQPAIRDQNSPYYVGNHQWPNATLYPYCSEAMVMASAKTAGKLSEAIPKLGIEYAMSFRVFDVVTGMAAKIASVALHELPWIFAWLPVENVCLSTMFAMHGIDSPSKIKQLFDYRAKCCGTPNATCPYNETAV